MVIIIGAGISGLSAAWHLQEANIDYLLLEASSSPGGYIQTVLKDGLVLEVGPNSILCDQEILDFIHDVGAAKELVPASPVSKARFILKHGKYRHLPDSPPRLLASSFFSLHTRLRILSEPFRKSASPEDESLDSFFTRRFSKEISDYALNPFIAGIYAGDPQELLVEETFPVLKEYERELGSVLKGLIRNKPGRRQSYNFRNGMATFPQIIASRLNHIKYDHAVKEVRKQEGKIIVTGETSQGAPFEWHASELIITAPAFSTAAFMEKSYPSLSEELKKIKYPPMTAVHSVYSRESIPYPLNGFGALNPSIENTFTSGCIWTSSVFPYKTPSDKFLFTSFIGGTLNAAKTQLPEDTIRQNVHEELSRFFGIKGRPEFQVLMKWDRAIPQYNKQLKTVKGLIPQVENDHIHFCCNWLNGVSLSDCIKKGKKLAEKIIKLHH